MNGFDSNKLGKQHVPGPCAGDQILNYLHGRDNFKPLVHTTRSPQPQLAPTINVGTLIAGSDGKYGIGLDAMEYGLIQTHDHTNNRGKFGPVQLPMRHDPSKINR